MRILVSLYEVCRKWGYMYLDLVSVDLDSTLNRFLHMLCVEVAETKMLDSAVLLEVLQSVNVLGIVILDLSLIHI